MKVSILVLVEVKFKAIALKIRWCASLVSILVLVEVKFKVTPQTIEEVETLRFNPCFGGSEI